MDNNEIGGVFRKCKCHHEIQSQMFYVKENMMKAHLEVKNQLIHNLENIIDEQEARIRNMDDYINGRIKSFSVRNKILKGISLLSLEFGTLSDENLSLKEAFVNAQRLIRLLQLKLDDPLLAHQIPEKIDKSCQTSEMKEEQKSLSLHLDSYQLYVAKNHEEMAMQILHEKNNNYQLLYNLEIIATLQKNVKQLMEAKIEMKKLITDIQVATREELRLMRKDMEIKIDCVIKSLMKRYQREVDARKRLHNKLVEMNGNIRVFCRLRPALKNYSKLSLLIDPFDNGLIIVDSRNSDRKKFNCDRAFNEKHTQSDIFEEIRPVITSCMDGYNVCIFAYGHTGSGKTYTMEGLPNDPGIYQRSINHLFRIAKERLNDIDYTISISMLEIYNEKIRDLLSNNKCNLPLRIGDNGIMDIPGLLVFNVNTQQQVQEVLEKGRMNRASATTELNDRSSRSHAIVCVRLRAMNRTTNIVTESRLNLVDLAGSERVSQSGATGQQLKEAQCINRSLSELGNVVTALRQRQQHIPFRNCQLTRLLESCLNGDSKTLVIVQLAPDTATIQETVSSLNFADKLSKIQKRNLNSKISHTDYGSLSTPSKHGSRQMNECSSCWVQTPNAVNLSLNTIQSCVCLADFHANGDYKLAIGDFGTEKYGIRLKIFKGFQVIVDNSLDDLPSALISFNSENVKPNPSSLALACDTTILIYKNLKPFYKFAIPSLEINKDEAEAWRQAEAGLINAAQLHTVLMELLHKLGIMELTTRSQKFLSCKETDREKTLEQCLNSELIHQSTITCMTTMKRSSSEVTAIDCIVYATEYGYVYCIDTQAFTVLAKCKIPGAPVFLHAAGLYDVDYRIFVSTRDAEIFKIKRDMKSVSDPIITMTADIIGMTRVGKQLVVACTDKTISFFAANGKCQNKIKLNETIRSIDTLIYEPKQYIALLVALKKEVRIYDETSLLDKEKVREPISWIRYGQFGYEEGALIIGTVYGGIIVKLFRRTANLEKRIQEFDVIQAQFQKINIPRRTRIYVDQTIRERKNAKLMHQIYQRDLFMLRLSVNRAFSNLMQTSLNSISTKNSEGIEISVEIHGFGPIFRMTINLHANSWPPLQHLYLILHYNQELYEIEDSLIPLPAMLPEMTYVFHVTVRCLEPDKGISDNVGINLVNHHKIIATALVNMPISEMSLLD